MITVQTIKQRLTDGSHVFNVSLIGPTGDVIEFPCLGERAAEAFTRAILVASEDYTLARVSEADLVESAA